jgi:hypothetical protein
MPVSPVWRRLASIAFLCVVVTAGTTAVTFGQPRIDVNGVAAPATVPAFAGIVVHVAVTDGPANPTDWLAVYPTGAADSAYLTWYYLSGTTTPPSVGMASATLDVVLPTSAGDYDVRLFAANGYSKVATGPTVRVLASAATIRVNGVLPPATVPASPASALTVVIANGPENPTDWIGLFPVGAADTSPLAWQYLNGSTAAPPTGQANATLEFVAPAAEGTYELRLFAAGGYARLVAGPSIVVGPPQASLVVNGTAPPASVTAGAGTVAVLAVVGGPGNATDWVGLYLTGAADQAPLTWCYLNGTTTAPPTGLTAATVSVLLPATPGEYEFRLFAANGYTTLATGSTIHVQGSTATVRVNGVLAPAAVSVSPATALTVVIDGAPANPTDWIGLYPVGASDTAYVEWQYLNGSTIAPTTGVNAATLAFFAPAGPGTYELRLFAGGGFSRLAVSPTIAVASPQAAVLVNGTAPPTSVTVASGSLAELTVTGAPGNATDWLGLYPAGAPDTAYVDWRYLNGMTTPPAVAVTDGTVPWVMPVTPATYEFRLFAHNTYQRVATSSPVTVPVSSALVAVNGVVSPQATTAGAGTVLTITIANGPANPADWVGLFVAGAPDSSPLTWQYLNGSTMAPSSGVPNASLRLLAPATDGAVDIRFFAANTYTRLATSGVITITPPAAQVAVNGVAPPASVSATPGSLLTVTVQAAPGNRADWLGLYRVADPDTAPMTWAYLSGTTALPVDPLTSGTWSIAAPSEAGRYDVRLFVDNSYARLATSAPIDVGQPAVSISLTSPFPGTVFPVGTPVTLSAAVSTTSRTVVRVEFEIDGVVIGGSDEPPYGITWNASPAGEYVLVAVATDNLGGRTSSSPVRLGIAATGPGTLGPPVLAPPGGHFSDTQTVTMQAAVGATIRYTTDGSEPDQTSPLYVEPITIEQDATVMARAFQDGWFPSPPAVGQYTFPQIVSMAVAPLQSTLTLGTMVRLRATGTFSDGRSKDVTALASWSSSDASIVVVSNLPGASGFARAVSPGTASITALLRGVGGSANVAAVPTQTSTPPTITGVTPSTGTAGTQVTISGSGFGESPGLVLVGTSLGVVQTWSDTLVVASIAPGSRSGSVQVTQGGHSSNTLAFAVTVPTITGVTPSRGTTGTSVTVTGSGFGTTQGLGQVWLGNAPATVTSWNDTEVVATVAERVPSGRPGHAQVLQNGTWSDAWPFVIGTPTISTITPVLAGPGAAVTISGSGFGDGQGSGIVWLGDRPGMVSSWTDTQIIATVDPVGLSGVVRVRLGGASSNGVALRVVPSDGSPSLTMEPYQAALSVGDTASLRAVDTTGTTVTGLTWASSDPTVAGLSTDDPPVVTALAPGHATVHAGTASSDITVHAAGAMPEGTVQWASPGDASGIAAFVPAAPSDSGVVLFAFQASGYVAAVRADGTTAWTAAAGSGTPDFTGGLLVHPDGLQLQRLDPMTGESRSLHTFTTYDSGIVLPHPDGTVFTVDGSEIVAFDAPTGAAKFRIQPPERSITSRNGACGEYPPGEYASPATLVGQPIIAGDGYAYFLYTYVNEPLASNQWVCLPEGHPEPVHEYHTSHLDVHARVLRVGTDGSSSVIPIGDWSEDGWWACVSGWPHPDATWCLQGHIERSSAGWTPLGGVSGALFTNADQGVLYLDTICRSDDGTCTNRIITITGGGVGSIASTPSWLGPVLQRGDDSFVGYADGDMAAFDAAGRVLWRAPGYTPLMATSGGGVIASSWDGLTTVTFDAAGRANGQLDGAPTCSWLGDCYAERTGEVSSVLLSSVGWDTSYAAMAGGNPTMNGTAIGVTILDDDSGPTFGLRKWSSTCFADLNSRSYLWGEGSTSYEQRKAALGSPTQPGPMQSPACQAFFEEDLNRAPYFSQLYDAVNSVQAWDGSWTSISRYNAGTFTADALTSSKAMGILRMTPVCSAFGNWLDRQGRRHQFGGAVTTAISQAQSTDGLPVRNVYFRTGPFLATEGTILHEALHIRTALDDKALAEFLGLNWTRDCPNGSTICITHELIRRGCASR